MFPDSKSTSLIADSEKLVDMTTFLDSGDIMLKIQSRYMLFDRTGRFIDEVEFKDIKESEDAEQKANMLRKIEQSRIYKMRGVKEPVVDK